MFFKFFFCFTFHLIFFFLLVFFILWFFFFFFFSSRRRHTRCSRDWSSDVCSSDLLEGERVLLGLLDRRAADRVSRSCVQHVDGHTNLVAARRDRAAHDRAYAQHLRDAVGGDALPLERHHAVA